MTQILANIITFTYDFLLVSVKYGITFTATMGIFVWAGMVLVALITTDS